MLPREADAAEHLDAVLGHRRERVRGDGPRGRDGEAGLGGVGARRRARQRRPRPRHGPARRRRACRRSGASRPGTGRSVDRTAANGGVRRPPCPRTTPAPPAPRPRCRVATSAPPPTTGRWLGPAVVGGERPRRSNVRSARRRVGSSDSSAVTEAWSRSTTYQRSSPATAPARPPRPRRRRRAPGPSSPSRGSSRRRPPPSRSSGAPSATDPTARRPPARGGTLDGPAPAWMTALAHTVGRNGPGAMARPSSSSTTASSAKP